jgi:hypothetical protein
MGTAQDQTVILHYLFSYPFLSLLFSLITPVLSNKNSLQKGELGYIL